MVKSLDVTKPTELHADELEKESALFWSIRNIRLPKGMAWDFSNRAWQAQIFDDPTDDLVVLKPTQVGMTTVMLCKMLHFATYNNVRAMYTLPRQDDVYDLVNGRLERIIADSPTLSSRIGTIDNVRFKTYGQSYLHFMESSVTPRMLDVDILVNDEVDMSNQDNLEQYVARLDASLHRIKYRISTPTIPNFGISSLYDDSDQKRWLVKCPSCNHYQELDWEKKCCAQKKRHATCLRKMRTPAWTRRRKQWSVGCNVSFETCFWIFCIAANDSVYTIGETRKRLRHNAPQELFLT